MVGMQSSIFLCLSQARINWEGCGMKGIGVKMGDDGGGSLTSSQGGRPAELLVYLLLLSSLAP